MDKKFRFFRFIITILVISSIVIETNTVSAWGDNSGLKDMRPSYTMEEINADVLGDKITFNSISNNPALGDGKNGNEKNFVAARKYNDVDHLWQADEYKNVEDGQEYVVHMYVHNNNLGGRDAVAKDTRVFFNITSESGKQVKVTGFLDSSNANPTEYWDHVYFSSDTAFHLEYVEGFALLANDGIGKGDGAKLSDNIVYDTKGVLIGHDALDGIIPGGLEFYSTVAICVKVVYDIDYTVDTTVRLVGDSDKSWKNEVDAKIGDKVEFRIEYTNTSDAKQNNVAIDDILPSNLHYIKGSTKGYSDLHPKGAIIKTDELVASGIYVGNYGPGANSIIRFQAEVVDDDFTCGKFILHNWGRVTVNKNDKVIQSDATVVVEIPANDNPKYLKIVLYIFIPLTIICFFAIIILQYRLYKLKRKR